MPAYLLLTLRVLAGLAGGWIIIITTSAAIRSFVLPRNESVKLNILVFRSIRMFFNAAAGLASTYAHRDRIMAHYAPVALVALPIAWETLLSLAYMLIYWALGEGSLDHCYRLSCNSLLTLGSMEAKGLRVSIFSYSEALLGLLLLTLLISYLPTIYQAFSRRETTVARLELRAGAPPRAATLLCWLHQTDALTGNLQQWADWEQWFIEIEESHTSLPILSYFRSPQPGRSWVMASGLILDTANLYFSALDLERHPAVELTFKAGCIALNRVFRFFDDKAEASPSTLLPDNELIEDPTQAGFREAYEELAARGLPMRADQEAAWQQYREMRVRYQQALDFLGRLTMVPELRAV